MMVSNCFYFNICRYTFIFYPSNNDGIIHCIDLSCYQGRNSPVSAVLCTVVSLIHTQSIVLLSLIDLTAEKPV